MARNVLHWLLSGRTALAPALERLGWGAARHWLGMQGDWMQGDFDLVRERGREAAA